MNKPSGPLARSANKTQNQVTVTRRLVPRGDGTSNVELSINLAEAGVPDRRYFADTAAVAVDQDFVRISFAQSEPEIRHVVVVILTVESIRNLLRHSLDFLRRCSEFMEKNKIPRRKLRDGMPPAGQNVALMANLVGIAMSGRECCLDLYHLSPWAMTTVQTSKMADVDPVLRIDAPTSLVVPLLEQLVKLQDELSPEAL